jgi:hypothetical protein
LAYKVTDTLPSIRLPSAHELSGMYDKLADTVQVLLERSPPQTRYGHDEEIQGAQWLFASRMGEKVRRSLVEQGVCKRWEVVPTRNNLEWQTALNQALVSVLEQLNPLPSADGSAQNHMFRYNGTEIPFRQLMDMEPTWVADRSGKSWSLEFDTLVVNVSCVGGEVRDIHEHIQTGFQLPECAVSVSVEDWYRCRRETRTVDEEWELME